MKLDLESIAQITGGRLFSAANGVAVTGISTDSRTLQKGDLFIPLRGPNFDGHDFLIRALRRGAAACLSEEFISGFPIPVIQVENTLKALGDLAAAFRRGFSGPVIAVTGSSGKTTTKEMLASILSVTGSGVKTEGNYNNLIGLPLTVFRFEPQHEWAVLELGMSARGEIARLSEIASPDIGVITNIGPAHLESLGGIEGVAMAKGELFAALGSGGTAVINADDKWVRQLPVANGVRRLLFGFSEEAEIRAEKIVARGGDVSFSLVISERQWPVKLNVAGRHNVHNALAAAAAASALGVEGKTIASGLESFRNIRGRTEVIRLSDGVVLLEDSYNANPVSVKAALTTLHEMGGEGRRIAVLGDMLELGPNSAVFHQQIGISAAKRADFLLLMGQMANEVAEGARQGGMAAECVHVLGSHEEVVDCLQDILQPGDRVLVKGSRGMKMEKVSAALREMSKGLVANHG